MLFLTSRLTDDARKLLTVAERYAVQYHQAAVEPELLLYALSREERGTASHLLRWAGVNLHRLQGQIEAALTATSPLAARRKVQLSSSSQRVLEYAREEARHLTRPYIGTEHLLLGLLRLEGSPALQLLEAQGLTYEVVHAQVVALLEQWNRASPGWARWLRRVGRLLRTWFRRSS